MLVRIPDVSIDLYLESLRQLDEALGELWMVMVGAERDLPLSDDDAAAIEIIVKTYRRQRDLSETQALAARSDGRSTFTLELDLPPEAGSDFPRLSVLLEQLDRLCERELWTFAASPEVHALRQRISREISAQTTRSAPSPIDLAWLPTSNGFSSLT